MTAPAPLAWRKLPVGVGYSTVLPDMDFETYSEAGYLLQGGRWEKLISGQKSGLESVGAARYTEDPTAEVLSLAYDLKDGTGPRMWLPGFPPPSALLDYIRTGGIIEAQNSIFEFFVWNNICASKYGWPPLPVEQTIDTAAKCRAFGIPGKLETAAQALKTGYQKDKDGKRLLNKFSIPKQPSKKDPSLRRRLEDDPGDAQRLLSYNVTDIQVEADVSRRCPDLQPDEHELWLVDQRINIRGVSVDVKALNDCIEIVRQATQKYTHELIQITGGAVNNINKVAVVKQWLEDNGLVLPDMTKGTIADTLKDIRRVADVPDGAPVPPSLAHLKGLNPVAVRVLEIRELLGSAAVKKLHSMSARLCTDEKLRGLFAFCGADRTGRFAGRGPQPQNLPSSGPYVYLCASCRNYTEYKKCPVCASPLTGAQEWNAQGAENALTVIASRQLVVVEKFYKDAVTAVSACLRGLFIAGPGKDLMCSDYSAIEAVVLACISGEQWRIDVFNDHGKIYEMSASKITGIPFEDFKRHKVETGEHHPMRKKVGKVAELACFGADTIVLTESGFKRLVDVTTEDRLHDGVEWVRHDGVINKGERLTTKMGSVTVTKEHKFFIGRDEWRTTEDLKGDTRSHAQAILSASSLLSQSSVRSPEGLRRSYAHAHAVVSDYIACQTLDGGRQPGAISVLKRNPGTLKQNMIYISASLTAADSLTGWPPRSVGAPTRGTDNTRRMGGAVSLFSPYGSPTARSGSTILSASPDGKTPRPRLTESTTTKGTNPVTSALCLIENSNPTKGKLCGLSTTAKKCRPLNSIGATAPAMPKATQSLQNLVGDIRLKELSTSKETAEVNTVYDVVNCGPRSRFVVLTDSGPIIAHNSGYQGGLGAWKNFGADNFMTDEEIKANVKLWRESSPAIVKFWYGIEDAARKAIQFPGTPQHFRDFTLGVREDVLYIRLLSGRYLCYHEPRLHKDVTPWGREVLKITYMGRHSTTGQWVRLDTYGGKLTENITQAVARDVFTFAMVNLERAGYPIVLHTHDEITSEVDHGVGSVEEFEGIMNKLPAWCSEWPIKVAGGWRGKRYRKD